MAGEEAGGNEDSKPSRNRQAHSAPIVAGVARRTERGKETSRFKVQKDRGS